MKTYFHAYESNGRSCHIGNETIAQVEERRRSFELVSDVTVIYQNGARATSLRHSANTIPHDCTGALCPCQRLLPDGYRIYESCGGFAPMKCIGNDWFFFPANGPLLVESREEAKWYEKREDAVAFIDTYVADEEANVDEAALTEIGPSPEVLAQPAAFDPSRWR